jgi:glycosyltransferase involved in cell wall biosynthesis
MGVPVVTEGLGSLRERLRDGETGFVAVGQAAFAEAAIRLLQDDELWLRQHRAALATQRGLAWEEVAGIWENRFLL